MGIRFTCHECGKKLNVKSFLAGKRGICPDCDARFLIPAESGGKAEPIVKSSASPGASAGLNPATNSGGAPVAAAPQGGFASPSASSPITRPATTVVQPAASAAAPASDPLSQSPNSLWYVRPSTGGQFGPAAGDMMRQWIAEGRVAADSLVWREGWAEWQSASAQFPQLSSPQPSVPSPTAPSPAAAPAAPTAPAMAAPVTASRPASTPVAAAAVAPVLGPSSQTSTGPKITPAKRSNGLTALMVIILVLVAIFLMVVFAFILYRQGGGEEYNEARLWQRPTPVATAWDQDTYQQL